MIIADSTAQHSTAQHSTAQHSTAQHSTAQHSGKAGLVCTAFQNISVNKMLKNAFFAGESL